MNLAHLLCALWAAALSAAVALPAQARGLPHYDAVAEAPPHPTRRFDAPQIAAELLKPGAPLHGDEHLGLPTFVWAARDAAATAQRSAALRVQRPEAAARQHLNDYAPLWGLTAADVQAAELVELHDTGTGPVIARFRQTVQGVPVFRDELRVIMDRDHAPIAFAGYLSPDAAAAAQAPLQFQVGARQAIAKALDDLHGAHLDPSLFDEGRPLPGGYLAHPLQPGATPADLVFAEPPRSRRVLFHLPDHLEPAHYVEIHAGSPGSNHAEYWSYVFSAVDGRMLFRHDLTAYDSFTYRVWADPGNDFRPHDGPTGNGDTPHPTGTPNQFQPSFVAPNLVTLQNAPFSKNDPWLAPGATQTSGNNVDAYVDLTKPDGLSGTDFRASTTAPGVFDRTYDPTKNPGDSQAQQMAAITQLFYDVNFFHDWYYDSGFDEKSGNAQLSNLGRGGVEGDPLHAEAQDYSGTDNSNMQTPSDGASPIMQMFLFIVPANASVEVLSPAAIAGTLPAAAAQFGPSAFDVTNTVLASVDAVGPDFNDGCDTFTNAADVSRKIAFINRGNCTFVQKVKNAQTAGAVAAIIANNSTTDVGVMAGTDASITIPSVLLQKAAADAMRAQLGNGVTVHIKGSKPPDRDGALDNQIVAHEWGHYISNRLIGDGNGLLTQTSNGMGEGWADFHAMLLTVRADDTAVATNATWNGVYALAGYASLPFTSDNYYFGIRRFPYSTDLTKDPLTFKHIQDGVPLPTTAVMAPGFDPTGVDNSEVHNTGEVWASMLWECYAALLRDTQGNAPRLTFAQAQKRMKDYIVAHYKGMPVNPTFLEARDSLLAAALANDPVDYALFVNAFAKRGAGTRAVAPDRYRFDNVGVVESFVGGNDLALVEVKLDDSTTAVCGAADGKLDAGEAGKLSLKLRNVGAGALSASTVTVTSDKPAVKFPAGATLDLPASAPLQTISASLPIAIDASVTGILSATLTLTVNDTGMSIPLTLALPERFNYDAIAGQSATDDVESESTAWTVSGNPALAQNNKFTRVALTPADHRWFMPDDALAADLAAQKYVPGDQYLISPPLQFGASGAATLTFKHRYSFLRLTSGTTVFNLDGGVIEISADDGATWADISTVADPGYSGALFSGAGNPIQGRQAYVGDSAGYPAQGTAAITFGPTLAGKTVRVRFRVGTTGIGGGWGWELDDLAFTNLANLPFGKLVGRNGNACDGRAPVANAGAAQTVNDGVQVALDGSASSSPDGKALTYQWVQKAGPAATLTNATSAKPSFVAPRVSGSKVATFALIVSDGALSSEATVDVTINHLNHAPVANAGADQSADGEKVVTLDGSASTDPDGDTLTYQWTQTAGAKVTLTGADSATPSFKAPSGGGKLTFQLVVSDGAASSDPALTNVNVKKTGCGCTPAGDSALGALLPLLALWRTLRRRKR